MPELPTDSPAPVGKKQRCEAQKPRGRSQITNGKRLFLGVGTDGRTQIGRRFRDVFSHIAGDLGGVDRMSEGQRQLARRVALLATQCEVAEAKAVTGQPFDLEAYGVMTDRLGRALQRLGLRRVPHELNPEVLIEGNRAREHLEAARRSVAAANELDLTAAEPPADETRIGEAGSRATEVAPLTRAERLKVAEPTDGLPAHGRAGSER